jgi:hypothetical protein
MADIGPLGSAFPSLRLMLVRSEFRRSQNHYQIADMAGPLSMLVRKCQDSSVITQCCTALKKFPADNLATS